MPKSRNGDLHAWNLCSQPCMTVYDVDIEGEDTLLRVL